MSGARNETNEPVIVDLGEADTGWRAGSIWSLPHDGDLDANLVRLQPGDAIDEHVNDEVDVLVFVLAGDGALAVDDETHDLRGDVLARIPRGATRAISAGPQGVTYLSIHRSRGPLTISPRS